MFVPPSQVVKALIYLQLGVLCDRCEEGRAQFFVVCHNRDIHLQCESCALHTDKERRWENREFASLN